MEDIQKICTRVYPFMMNGTDIHQALLVTDKRGIVMQIDLPTARVIEQCGEEDLDTKAEIEIDNTIVHFIDSLIKKLQWKVIGCYVTHTVEIQQQVRYMGQIEFETPEGKIRVDTNPVDLIVCMYYYKINLYIAELVLLDSGIEIPAIEDDDEITIEVKVPQAEIQNANYESLNLKSENTTIHQIANKRVNENGRKSKVPEIK